MNVRANDLPFSRSPPFQQPGCGRGTSQVYICRGALMPNPVEGARKAWIYHNNIAIFWADNHKTEEKGMLLKAHKTPAGGVEVLELEPKNPFGIPLEADFSDGPPPQLFYEVASHAPGSPTEVLISAESMVPESKWNDPNTECDFVGNLVDAVSPREVVAAATDLVKQHPTYSPGDGDCQTFVLLLMAALLSLDYVDASDLDHYLTTETGLANTVQHAINNARGRPGVITSLLTARQLLYDKLSDWVKKHLEAGAWNKRDLERLDHLCEGDRFADGQWSRNKELQRDWVTLSGGITGVIHRNQDWAAFGINELCKRRRASGGAEEAQVDFQHDLDDYNAGKRHPQKKEVDRTRKKKMTIMQSKMKDETFEDWLKRVKKHVFHSDTSSESSPK